MKHHIEPLLLRPAQVAEALNVSRSGVYALIKAGEIPAVKVGCSWRVPVTALRKWVEESRTVVA